MELFGGLSFLGNILNKNNNNEENQAFIKERKLNNSKNIYDNDTYKKSFNKIRKNAKQRYNDARNPKSGIIPPYYNSNRTNKKKYDPIDNNMSDDSEFSDVDSYDGQSCDNGSVTMDDPMCFYRKEKKFNNNQFEKRILKNAKSGFLEQFDPLTLDNAGAPVASNSVADIIGDDGSRRLELERDMALNAGFSNFGQDSTYGVVSKENFVHNNMMPFFKSKDGGFNPYTELKNAEMRQRRMETFTGSANNLDYRPKTERRRLFDPVAGLTNMYGTPVLTDVMDSRYIPGMERRNERPFQEVRVTPGLNLGYNEVAKFGEHDPFRVLPKTVDELRVASKPKLTYGSVVIPGMKGQRSAVPSKMYKRRPLTFWEQTPEDNIRGQSYIKGPTIHAEVDSNNLATVNRGVETNKRALGGAKFFTDLHKPDTLIEKTKVSQKENFKNDIVRNAQKQEGNEARGFDDTYNPKVTLRDVHDRTERAGQMGNNEFNKPYIFDGTNWIPDPTMRDLHEKTDRAGNMGNGELNKAYIFDGTNWIPDPTMRDLHEKTDRAGNMGNTEHNKGYIFDGTNWVPDPTMRDLHEKTDRAGNMGTREHNKGYIFDGTNWIPDPTMRDLHDKTDRAGNMGTREHNKGYVFDGTNWIPDPTMRDLHEKTDRAGNMGNGEHNKGYIFDGTNWIPDPTMRDLHDRTERAGQMGTNQLNKGYTYDGTNWIPDPTMRDLHDRTERAGQMGNNQLNKPYVYDGVNWIPDPTMRDLHEKTDRAGNMGNGELDKPFVFDMVNNIQEPTMRDIHDKYDRAGNGRGPREQEKQRSRGDANNMRVNTEKEVVAAGRKPTDSNFSRGPTVDFTMMNLKEPLNINRDIYPDIQQTTTEKFGFIGTRSKQTLPQQSFRFFTFVDENLAGNPLVNNVLHQSNPNSL